jgi:thiosulfate dehydrogenase
MRTLFFVFSLLAVSCRRHGGPELLLPESADISRATERPRDPFRDPVAGDAAAVEAVKIGYLLFTQTPHFLTPMVASRLACSNCHLNAGQRLGALPVVGAARAYPAPSTRAGRPISLADRLVGCLLRSTNAAGGSLPAGRVPHENAGEATFPSPGSFEVRALAAYVSWLSEGVTATPWRERGGLSQLPLSELDPARGARLYRARCATCHGEDGAGVPIGPLRPGPLWGEGSWNDGAGFARTYTLAAFLRRAMPYSAPGSLRDDEAQHLAAFLTRQPRPAFPEKARDYPGTRPPEDAVYYPRPPTGN